MSGVLCCLCSIMIYYVPSRSSQGGYSCFVCQKVDWYHWKGLFLYFPEMPFLQNSDGAYSHNWRSKMGTVQNIFIKHCNLLILRTLLVIFSTLFYKVYFTQSFYFGVMRILTTTIVSQKRIKCLLQLNMKQHHHQMSYPLSEKKHWTK